MDEPIGTLLPLSEAVLTWCAPQLVEEIRKHERRCSRHDLISWRWPRLVPDAELRQPTGDDWMAGGSSSAPALRDAWANLENECRRLMRAGEIYLSGVPVKPELTTETQLIPAAWASELKFDLIADAILLPGRKFANVLASKQPPVVIAGGLARPSGRLPLITPENLRELSDEEVFLIVEDHARRVVESPSANLSPGKLSFMPIIIRKLRFRADHGELLETLAAEARALEAWIKGKVPSHQTPTVGTIENFIRIEYASKKAQSKAMI